MPYRSLFKPIKIRGLELKNRAVFPATATNLAEKGGFVSDRLADYHAARARGGCGLNITEAASVHAPSAAKNMLSVYDDKFIPGLKKLADAIHLAGGKACLQLCQGGMAAADDVSVVSVVPSDMCIAGAGKTVPAASLETIRECVSAFGRAAARAVAAGFDCVEFHVAHGDSPHMFLSPAFNGRQDEYGGSPENRARYPLECIAEIRKNIPEDMPLFMRIVAKDDCVENGLEIEDVIEFCKAARDAGVDVLDVTRGNPFTPASKYEVPPIDIPRGFNVENAAKIKEETNMITIAVGRINGPKQANDIIAEGKADMVALGRAQIADPDFCKKALLGKEDDIVRCIACNQGCADRNINPAQPYISCLRNPAAGREKEFELVKTDAPKKVIVAGGGMAGLEAAITLKRRGHRPVLFEETGRLGGQFLLAGAAPRKSEMRDAAVSRGRQAYSEGVEIRLRTRVTGDVLSKVKPDAVIIATGSVHARPDIPGIDLPHVLYAQDVLSGKSKAEGGVVVVGGGITGLEAAEFLSDRGNRVTVVEMREGVGRDFGSFRMVCVSECLKCERIRILDRTKCVEIGEGFITAEKDGEKLKIECDSVVIATGSVPSDYSAIKEYCEKNAIPYYIIGDAKKPRHAVEAIAEGAEVARKI